MNNPDDRRPCRQPLRCPCEGAGRYAASTLAMLDTSGPVTEVGECQLGDLRDGQHAFEPNGNLRNVMTSSLVWVNHPYDWRKQPKRPTYVG